MYGWGRPEDTGKTAPVLILGSPSTGFGSDRYSLPWTAQYTLRMHPNKNGPVKVSIKRFSSVREAKLNRSLNRLESGFVTGWKARTAGSLPARGYNSI